MTPRTRRFEIQEGDRTRLYELTVHDGRLTRRSGILGGTISEHSPSWYPRLDAEYDFARLAQIKVRQGWTEILADGTRIQHPPPKASPHPKLIRRSGGMKRATGRMAELMTILLCDEGARIHPLDEPLFLAILDDDIGGIRAALAAGAEVNCYYSNLGTPLHVAAIHGRNLACEYLLSHGASLAAKTGSELLTPLHYAVMGGDGETVQIMADAGAKVKGKASHPTRDLRLMANMTDNASTIDALMALGLRVDTDMLRGTTAFQDAILRNSLASVAVMIRRGVLAPDPTLKTLPLHAAHHAEMMRLLLQSGEDPNGRLPPDRITLKRDYDRMNHCSDYQQALLSTIIPGHGYTPLHVAAARRRVDLVRMLIAYGADLSLRDGIGNRPKESVHKFCLVEEATVSDELAGLLSLEGSELDRFRAEERARIEATPLRIERKGLSINHALRGDYVVW